MASETAKFESAQALFCSIADYVGQAKIENVLNVTTYPTYASFLKGQQLKPKKETNLAIAKLAYTKCDTPEMSFTNLTSFLKDKAWYESSVWIAKHLIKKLSGVSKLTKFDVLDARGYNLGYRYVRGDEEVMGNIETLFKICNDANKDQNKLAGGKSSEIIFGDVNKWSPADIYFASLSARTQIKNELKKAQTAKRYSFGGKKGLNKLISNLIATGHLLPLSLKKAGRKVKIEKVNFSKKTKATILETVNYKSNSKNENTTYNATTKLWVKPEPRMGVDNKGNINVDKYGVPKIPKGKPGSVIPPTTKGFPVFIINDEDYLFKQIKGNKIKKFIFGHPKKEKDKLINKLSDDDVKIYRNFEYSYLEHLEVKIKESRAGAVPVSRSTAPRDMNIPIVSEGGSSMGTIQMRHDPSGTYGSWKVDFKYTGAGARGGSMVSQPIFASALKLVDHKAGADWFTAYDEGKKEYAAVINNSAGSAPDIYKTLGFTTKDYYYYGPRGLENDPPSYMMDNKGNLLKTGKKPPNGWNRARLKGMPWRTLTRDKDGFLTSNVYDYQRGEISALCVINRIMPVLTSFWNRSTPDIRSEFCQIIFKYVTSRADTSAKFVIAK